MANLDSKKEEIVMYDNTFNKTSLSVLTQVQTDVLMSVLSKMGKSKDEEGRFVAEYNFKDIREMTEMSELYSSRLKKTLDDLINTKVEFYENGVYYKGNLFSNYIINEKTNVTITLSTDMTKKIMINEKEYTVLELKEYVDLKNRYSKELYRLLRQFRHTGLLIIKKEDLLRIFSPPKSYNEYDFIRKNLNPSIKDNERYFENLKMINFEGNGNALPDICKFTFKKHLKAENLIEMKEKEDEIELLEYIMRNGGAE